MKKSIYTDFEQDLMNEWSDTFCHHNYDTNLFYLIVIIMNGII